MWIHQNSMERWMKSLDWSLLKFYHFFKLHRTSHHQQRYWNLKHQRLRFPLGLVLCMGWNLRVLPMTTTIRKLGTYTQERARSKATNISQWWQAWKWCRPNLTAHCYQIRDTLLLVQWLLRRCIVQSESSCQVLGSLWPVKMKSCKPNELLLSRRRFPKSRKRNAVRTQLHKSTKTIHQ